MKIKSAQLGPDQLARFLKGVVVVADPKRGIIVRSRPKRKKPRSKLQEQFSTRFGIAGVMASSPLPLELQTAIEMAKGTEQVPRDILTMAALGNYYQFVGPDGQEWGHVPGAVYPGKKTEFHDMELWSMYESANLTPNNLAGYSWKGMSFYARETFDAKGFRAILTTVSSGTYQFCVGTIDGSATIQTINFSPPQLGGYSQLMSLYFPLEYTIQENDRVFMMVGRTDAGPTYGLPVYTAIVDAWQFAHTYDNLRALQKVTPAVGDTFTVTGANRTPIGIAV